MTKSELAELYKPENSGRYIAETAHECDVRVGELRAAISDINKQMKTEAVELELHLLKTSGAVARQEKLVKKALRDFAGATPLRQCRLYQKALQGGHTADKFAGTRRAYDEMARFRAAASTKRSLLPTEFDCLTNELTKEALGNARLVIKASVIKTKPLKLSRSKLSAATKKILEPKLLKQVGTVKEKGTSSSWRSPPELLGILCTLEGVPRKVLPCGGCVYDTESKRERYAYVAAEPPKKWLFKDGFGAVFECISTREIRTEAAAYAARRQYFKKG